VPPKLHPRGRPAGLALVALLVALVLAPEVMPVRVLRLAAFDIYQALAPRRRMSAPVVIVDIDDSSLARFDQWPWPRTRLAQLVAAIAEGQPAAIGIDIVMSEPDRLSPDRLSDEIGGFDPLLARELARLPSSDALLGATLQHRPAVVGMIGLDAREPGGAILVQQTPVRMMGGDPRPFLRHFPAALRSVDAIDRGAVGHGLINAVGGTRIVRRMSLVATVAEAIVPALGVEMLRVASGEPALVIQSQARGVQSVGIGDLAIPTEPDASVWIHFAPPDPSRFISAGEVLSGRADPRQFERKLVLIGVTALGLGDRHATPVAPRMPGVEIHAQLLEGIFDGGVLVRPRWARWGEAALLAVGGALLVFAVPGWPAGHSALLAAALVAAPLALGGILYLRFGILADAVMPSVGIGLVYAAMLGFTLTEVQRQRRTLRRQLEAEREASARVAGELEAARRIQMGILPKPADALRGDDRVKLYACLDPARIVGGDLYDFFRLDRDRLFFLVGDVSGQGVPGCLFMAVSKALCKSIALRRAGDLGAMMRESNAEISRDNAEALFVTAWAGVLDAATGRLEYCNAGHEPAWLLDAGGFGAGRLTESGGPPLCVIDDFPYVAASHQLRPGETICLVTDGVTEAVNAGGELYGRRRLDRILGGLGPSATAVEVGEAIRADVGRFAGGAEASDDLTILVVRWTGGGRLPAISAP
jgi:adenylate cyclase